MRARYYSPELRRFINADIIAGEISNAVTLNRYAYANGNPVSNIDPFGLAADGRGSIYESFWIDEYDAIYVVDYGEYGLDIVGHSYLLLKKDNGLWIKTHFTGDIKDKKNASIETKNIYNLDIISDLNQSLESIKILQNTQTLEYVFGIFPLVVETSELVDIYIGGVQYVPLKGDFSESIELAYHYKDSKYGGYNVLNNNCAHYVQEILRAGVVDNSKIENFLESSDTIVPSELYMYLNAYNN